MMRFMTVPASGMAAAAATVIYELAGKSPGAAVAVPTGKTPLPLYALLAQEARAGDRRLAGIQWFALDEFLGPNVPYEARFSTFLHERFLLPADLAPTNLHSMDGGCQDPAAETARYEAEIAAHGGLALAVLGIGSNGHIGFNEPGTPLDSRTGVRTLAATTLEANRYLFRAGQCLPTQALTMGLATLMEARRILLLATGSGKREVIARLRNSVPSPDLPASVLHLHPDCTVITDF
jgi:glucosamine-6-phosphate deaminase